MPTQTSSRDRFDDAPRNRGRVGAHRAEKPGGRGIVVVMWVLIAIVVFLAAGTVGFLALFQNSSLLGAADAGAAIAVVGGVQPPGIVG
ncbi:hypothetical protein [Microbacterium halotolerans]|uniref:hypothetical protein n=1 Tax=Microbacterium halotolerans TaxID=246613 RepID=UPI000E6A995B|nr:hypothetical protein [Microbacterium halotolerans]